MALNEQIKTLLIGCARDGDGDSRVFSMYSLRDSTLRLVASQLSAAVIVQ
jgi:hypothetical protein